MQQQKQRSLNTGEHPHVGRRVVEAGVAGELEDFGCCVDFCVSERSPLRAALGRYFAGTKGLTSRRPGGEVEGRVGQAEELIYKDTSNGTSF